MGPTWLKMITQYVLLLFQWRRKFTTASFGPHACSNYTVAYSNCTVQSAVNLEYETILSDELWHGPTIVIGSCVKRVC